MIHEPEPKIILPQFSVKLLTPNNNIVDDR